MSKPRVSNLLQVTSSRPCHTWLFPCRLHHHRLLLALHLSFYVLVSCLTITSVIATSSESFPVQALSLTSGASNCNQWFSSDQTKSGTFYSPNYADPYPANLHCVYNFTGKGKERVRIVFNDFSVYKPEDTDKDCNGADVLMAYITINGQRKRLDNLCGDERPKPLMSNDNSITLEFKTFHVTEHHRGFSANFSFVTNFGINSGRQDNQKVCGFVYSSRDSSNGTFTSPNFPGFYPRDTECHYFFYGEPTEKVHITFTDFKVEGISPCTTETASDYVEFSNYKTVDRKIPRHCGSKKPVNIESDGDFFRITFKSNDRFDETGFKAYYEFKKPEDVNPIKQVRQIPSGSAMVQRLHYIVGLLSTIVTLLYFQF